MFYFTFFIFMVKIWFNWYWSYL